MAKKFLFYFLFISVLGVSQVTLINNSNLNGFVVSNINPLSAIVTKSNTSSQIGVTSGFNIGYTLDSTVNFSCYDSIKIICTMWRSGNVGSPNIYVSGSYCSTPSIPILANSIQTIVITTTNTSVLSFSVYVMMPFPGTIYWCGGIETLYLKNLKVIGYGTATTSCNAPANQPIAINGSTNVCNATINTYFTPAQCGVTNYSWTLPSGWNGISNTNTISATAGFSGGLISVVATNTCGESIPQTLSVSVNPHPIISVNAGTICSGNSFTLIPNGASTYTFSSGNAIVSPTNNSTYTVIGTSLLGCISSNTAISLVTVYPLP